MAKVAILFIVAFVPSLQAGLLEHLTTEVENLKTIQATQSAEMARYKLVKFENLIIKC